MIIWIVRVHGEFVAIFIVMAYFYRASPHLFQRFKRLFLAELIVLFCYTAIILCTRYNWVSLFLFLFFVVYFYGSPARRRRWSSLESISAVYSLCGMVWCGIICLAGDEWWYYCLDCAYYGLVCARSEWTRIQCIEYLRVAWVDTIFHFSGRGVLSGHLGFWLNVDYSWFCFRKAIFLIYIDIFL